MASNHESLNRQHPANRLARLARGVVWGYDSIMNASMNTTSLNLTLDFMNAIDLRNTDADPNAHADLITMINALINDDFAPITAIIADLPLDASIECAIEHIASELITRCFLITDLDEMIDLLTDLLESIE